MKYEVTEEPPEKCNFVRVFFSLTEFHYSQEEK